MLEEKSKVVGVCVGRWQVDTLHDGHLKLINEVANSHERLIIFVGVSLCKSTFSNPLDFISRKFLLEEHFPNATILDITDVGNNELWSKKLDDIIIDLIDINQSACLYGSRDSFLPHYRGKFETKQLTQESYFSGTDTRNQLLNKTNSTRDFRAGAIWSQQNTYQCPHFCVDSALFSDDYKKILLGRKNNEDKFRLIGGFVDNNESLEEAVARESMEEASIVVKNTKYIGSFPMDDYRYRGERDKITTTLFASHFDGIPIPSDDIYELRWFDFSQALPYKVMPIHKKLIESLVFKIPKLKMLIL